MAAQLGVLPVPTGGGRNAPPSNEDIARVAVGALLDPHRHDGRAYRPTGPTLLSGAEIADAVGEALGRRVRHIDIPPRMFMKAVRVNAKRLGFDLYFESGVRYYAARVRPGNLGGGRPDDSCPRCRRRRTGRLSDHRAPLCHRPGIPTHRRQSHPPSLELHVDRHWCRCTDLDRFDRLQQHPQPAHPRLSGESVVWRDEHTASTDPTHDRFGAIKIPPVSVSPNRPWDQRLSS